MAQKLEARILKEMKNILLAAGEEVVYAQHFIPVCQQSVT
jgi:hypothetical protein